jgi:hypothetical protein
MKFAYSLKKRKKEKKSANYIINALEVHISLECKVL